MFLNAKRRLSIQKEIEEGLLELFEEAEEMMTALCERLDRLRSALQNGKEGTVIFLGSLASACAWAERKIAEEEARGDRPRALTYREIKAASDAEPGAAEERAQTEAEANEIPEDFLEYLEERHDIVNPSAPDMLMCWHDPKTHTLYENWQLIRDAEKNAILYDAGVNTRISTKGPRSCN